MEIKQVVARNVLWNWAGMAVGMLAGFVVAPFLVHHLGVTVYGLWILIASLTSYFGLLDLGVRGSVGRYIAYHRAKNDLEGVNATLSTATAILSVVGIITLVGTFGILLVFSRLFDIPADQVGNARTALLLVGVNLALTFPLSIFEATLWAFQRFDLLNAVDIPATLIRTGLTFLLVGSEQGLVALAWITLLTTVGSGLAKAALSFRVEPSLRVNPGLLKLAAAREIYGFGLWHFLLNVSLMVYTQISFIIVAHWLSVQLVTSYSIAMRLVGYASSILVASTGVLTPLATAYHAGQKHSQQQELFVQGGKFCLAFSLYFFALFLFLGKPLILLWMGSDLENAWPLLVVIALGQLLPMSQWITHSMILGMGRHRFMAWVSMAECVVATPLAIALVRPYGVMGVCVAFALCAAVCRGLIQVVSTSRMVEVPVSRYVLQALVFPALAAALPAAGLAAVSAYWSPSRWSGLVLETAAFSLCYAAVCAVLLLGWNQVRAALVGIFPRGAGLREAVKEDAA